MHVVPGKGIVDVPPKREKRHFANWLTAYREYTRNHEATPKVHMWTAISVLAAALERRVWLEHSYYKVFPNLFMFIIGAPGLVKKSTSTAIGVDLLRALPDLNIMAERITSSALISSLERACRTFSYKDEPIKQSAVFAYASELTVFMEEIAGNITDLLTTFYDCQPQDSSKPWVYESRMHGEQFVYGPCLNILGCSTPTWLKRVITPSQMEGGFTSRILFVIENDLPEKFIALPKMSPDSAAFKQKLVEDLFSISDLAGEMTLAPDAAHFYTEWYEKHMHDLHERGGGGRFAGYFGRKPLQVEKLAMVVSVAESNSLVVTLQHMQKATLYIELLEKDMITGFTSAGRSDLADPVVQVYRFIAARGKCTFTELINKFFTDLDMERLRFVLTQLQQMRQILSGSNGKESWYAPNPDAPDINGISLGRESEAGQDAFEPLA